MEAQNTQPIKKKKADLIEIEVQGIYPLTTLRVPEAPF